MHADLEKILSAAIHAPSGENCQQWLFRINDLCIDILNIPDKDKSLYNLNHNADYIAHGALVENVVIASGHFGYETTVVLFPNAAEPSLVSRITLKQTKPQIDPLYEAIRKRSTNRKPYEETALTRLQQESLSGCAGKSGVQVHLRTDRHELHELAHALSANERIVFENKQLHDFFFGHIRWTKADEVRNPIGFLIDTLELTPPQRKAFNLFKNWHLLQIANAFGISKRIAHDNAKTYASCAAHGAVIIKTDSNRDYFEAGRVMQRVWLTATALGLQLQPITGVVFLMKRISAGHPGHLSIKHQKLISTSYNRISKIFKIPQNATIAMFFRVGIGPEPSARTYRSPLREMLY